MQKTQVLRIVSQFIAQHCWPEAPEEVVFLRSLHRHVFHVIVKIPTVGDRQLEFFMVQTRLNSFLKEHFEGKVLGRSSCEVMAEKIGLHLMELYDLSTIEVEVNEDGENGSIIALSRESKAQPEEKSAATRTDAVTIATEQEVSQRLDAAGASLNRELTGFKLLVMYTPDDFLFVADLLARLPDVDVTVWCGELEDLELGVCAGAATLRDANILICSSLKDRKKGRAITSLLKYCWQAPVGSARTITLLDITGDARVVDYNNPTCFWTSSPVEADRVVGYGLNSSIQYGHRRFLGVTED